ncbi:Gfo/Idh/MocA family oxidoreductase [Sphingomonas aliaeris]|uniref:Gfo/Idh/MocA family oxidoreductase n=1 Tax=Sphingomonas aliaeris TaxID=2759526 RepID=A0A974NTU0_9SPHN|nr:Gfo/Idh/MocA family oxidoreductase [Sphingomonas aliaeris]QQV76658.1 Gfo/Idh/MocA family oxidoreductase [Sphingomonas aliaeris]
MRKSRLGFLGVGWIGRHRMEAMLATGSVEAAVLSDPSPDMLAAARALAPDAAVVGSLDAMLAQDLDGIVIATPSGLHAEQSIRALENGVAVFCQKPLGRNAAEAARVVAAARTADRLLSVDFSYRFTIGMIRIAELVRTGALGDVYAVDLTFHNAYGPDKPWFYDRSQSGGGCVMDLGVHLVDLALWVLDFPGATADISAALFAQGMPLVTLDRTEDYAVASVTLETGTIVRLACSWRLNAGVDARIEAAFYGTKGGAAMRNVGGSFYDFRTERFTGTTSEVLADAPDDWGGRAAATWARRLHADPCFDPAADQLVMVATILDRIYASG